MKSQSIKAHYMTLKQQRDTIYPKLKSISRVQLWKRPKENKWSIGETMYHLYLITRMLRVAATITIPYTKLFARMMRNKPFETDIKDIYKAYKEKHGRGMKAPFILNPPTKIYNTMDFNELNQLLIKETKKLMKIVEGIEEDIAGHIIFFDPIASNPNLIQAIQLLAIHEAHHINIIQYNLESLSEKNEH